MGRRVWDWVLRSSTHFKQWAVPPTGCGPGRFLKWLYWLEGQAETTDSAIFWKQSHSYRSNCPANR